MKQALLFTFLLFFSFFAHAQQAGDLDRSFNYGLGSKYQFNYGYGQFSYILGYNSRVSSTVIQSDGKILIGGFFSSYNGTVINSIARLNTDGSIDASFNPAGTGANNDVKSIVLQTDGKILIGGGFNAYNGNVRNYIARLNADGSLDASFNPAGIGTQGTDFYKGINSIALQSDGKILIGGSFYSYNGTVRNSIARLNTDGSLDTSFNPGSGADNKVNSIAIQKDGKILIGGNFTTYNGTQIKGIARLRGDGSLDFSFNPAGTGAIGGFNGVLSIVLQSNGKILIGGDFTTYNGTAINSIARLKTDGNLDTSFNPGTDAKIRFYKVESIALQPDGKILIGGGDFFNFKKSKNSRSYIARLNTNGSFDTSFGSENAARAIVSSIALQSDGKIFIGIYLDSPNTYDRSYVARLNTDGSLDNSLNPVGTGSNHDVNSIALQTDGKILIGGHFNFYNGKARNSIARLNTDGSLDNSFNPAGTGTNHFSGLDGLNSIRLQSDGRILIGGQFRTYNGTERNCIARLYVDGSLDTNFNPGTGADYRIKSIALQKDGKILIGGDFRLYNGTARNGIARLNKDGSLDTSFNPGGIWAHSQVESESIVLQPDGKILIGVEFTTYNGLSSNITRLNLDGSQDKSFNPAGTGAHNRIISIRLQNDGKILIGGRSTSYNGTTNNIARLNNDGSLDISFNPTETRAYHHVNSIALQPDGKILIGGVDTSNNGYNKGRIIRLNKDGSLDASFNPITHTDDFVQSIALQNDGKILIGGAFTGFNNLSTPGICRILGSTKSNKKSKS